MTNQQNNIESDKEQAQAVIGFWKEAGPKKWFSKDDNFDQAIQDNFGPLLNKAINGELDTWTKEPSTCLAFIIMLDQFSRNLNRNSAKAFEQDPKALQFTIEAIEKGYLDKIDPSLKLFMILPLMHSEDLANQDQSIALIEANQMDMAMRSAKEHRDIIKEFGRFPHRNAVLGRKTTPNEQAFLDNGGFKG
ncbi:MAG: DUF924 family protein [Nitratireductor sp.]